MSDRAAPSMSFPGRARDAIRPVWDKAFKEPVRDSHIRLQGMTAPARQLSIIGLVTLGFLLLSVLYNDIWRRGDLLPLDTFSGQQTFLPLALLPVTLICFFLAWALIMWGATASAASVRIILAAVFLLSNATFGVPTSIDVGESLALDIGPTLIKMGYFAAPVLLVLSAFSARSETWTKRIRPVVRALILVSLGMLFFTHLWVHITFVNEGFAAGAQTLVSGAITEIEGLLLPLVYVSGILVIDFSFDVAEGVALSARRASARVAKLLLVALLALKIWVQIVSHFGDWLVYFGDRPTAVIRTVVSLAFLALAVALIARLKDKGGFDQAKERLMYGSGAILAFNIIALILVVGLGLFILAHLNSQEAPGFVNSFPSEGLSLYGRPVVAALVLTLGVWLVRRDEKPTDQEIGSGMIIMAAWVLPSFLIEMTDLELGFNDALLDAVLTLAIAVYVAVRWRKIDTPQAVTLAAITVFAWLVMTKGDWISVLGSLAGLPSVFIVVFGIVFSLAGDAGFTRSGIQGMPHGLRPFILSRFAKGNSNRLPQGARPLLFVGYLILSVTILNWILATHEVNDQGADASAGFFYLGIPWAAWLIGRRLLRSGETEIEEQVDEASA